MQPLAEVQPLAWSLRLVRSLLKWIGSPLGEDADDIIAGYRRLGDPFARFLVETEPHGYDVTVWREMLRTGRPTVDPASPVGLAQDKLAGAYKPSGT